MKILCVIESGTWVERHIVTALRDMGHVVSVFHYGDAVGEFYGRNRADTRRARNQALSTVARESLHGAGLDFIFAYVYDDFLEPRTAQELAALNVPMVNYNVDMLTQWYRQTRTAKYFTCMLCAQKANMPALARYSTKVMYFPMAAARPGAARASACKGSDVAFVGSPTAFRRHLLAGLLERCVDVDIYGYGWQGNDVVDLRKSGDKTWSDLRHYFWPKLAAEGPSGMFRALRERIPIRRARPPAIPNARIKGCVASEDLASLFASSAINLGINRMHTDDPNRPGQTQIKLRDFEVPMAGGFYLTEGDAEYAALFEPDAEVVIWRTLDELIAAVRQYSADGDARQSIAAAGHARAVRDHTWAVRFAGLFDELGLEH